MKKFITLFLLALLTSASVAQWSEQTSGVNTTLYSVSVIDNNMVWICGAGGKVLRTTNGGVNWAITSSPNSSLDLYNIWGIDSNRALVTGSASTTYVYKTTNAGVNWTQVFSQSGGFINAIVHLTAVGNEFAMIGDPVGGRWSLWHSNNNGSTWDSAGLYIPQAGSETGYNNSAFDIGPNGSDYFWFGTNNTRIYRGYFGSNWIFQPTTGQQNSLAILFVDSLIGVMGGSTGMLSTTNGGTNWVGGAVPGNGSINGFAIGNSIGEMFYSRGTSIYQTTNSGVNWVVSTTQTGTYNHMQRARADGQFNIWAIRSNGGISKYTYPIGIKPVSGVVPNSYILYQNFPNPFNPSTKIKFDITTPLTPPEGGTPVRLVVYDILGKEIRSLVNEQLKAGTYEVEWNAFDYPSGVYFYKLTAGDYAGTKKMVLLK
jgi:photosystem II stability/assembly factor-like uncharacterized protein